MFSGRQPSPSNAEEEHDDGDRHDDGGTVMLDADDDEDSDDNVCFCVFGSGISLCFRFGISLNCLCFRVWDKFVFSGFG